MSKSKMSIEQIQLRISNFRAKIEKEEEKLCELEKRPLRDKIITDMGDNRLLYNYTMGKLMIEDLKKLDLDPVLLEVSEEDVNVIASVLRMRKRIRGYDARLAYWRKYLKRAYSAKEIEEYENSTKLVELEQDPMFSEDM